jgi:outer membrane PBP1 activator LpoA protein
MFNLIITIISIALVVAMAAAAVYYGGTAFTQGTAKANAATLVTQAQQINGAIECGHPI